MQLNPNQIFLHFCRHVRNTYYRYTVDSLLEFSPVRQLPSYIVPESVYHRRHFQTTSTLMVTMTFILNCHESFYESEEKGKLKKITEGIFYYPVIVGFVGVQQIKWKPFKQPLIVRKSSRYRVAMYTNKSLAIIKTDKRLPNR